MTSPAEVHELLNSADVVLVRVTLEDAEGLSHHGGSIEDAVARITGVDSAEIVASNAVEHETALDELVGAVEGAVSTLRGEADELRNREGYNDDEHLIDVVDGLAFRAGQLEYALERFLEDVAPPEREIEL